MSVFHVGLSSLFETLLIFHRSHSLSIFSKIYRIHPKYVSTTPVSLVQFYLLDPPNKQLRSDEKHTVHNIVKMDVKSSKFDVNCPFLCIFAQNLAIPRQ